MKLIDDKKEFNLGLVIILILNAVFWFSVFIYGFFISFIWFIVIGAITGIIVRLKENRY